MVALTESRSTVCTRRASSLSTLEVDNLRFLEWRNASDLPDGFFAIDAVRATGSAGRVELLRTKD